MKGSPPHARGKVPVLDARQLRHGITPARAGKSFKEKYFGMVSEDHPRTRGEKSITAITLAWSLWITPARAGKSFHCAVLQHSGGDHPRTRGEKTHLSLRLSL